MYKIIGSDGKEYGPVTAEVIRQWIAEGRINAQTRLCLDGTADWRTLAEFPEFAAIGAGAAGVGQAAQASAFPTMPSGGLGGYGTGDAVAKVSGPAVGLIITAIIGFLTQVAALVFNLFGASMMQAQHTPNEAWAAMTSGPIAIFSAILGAVLSFVVLFGALKMKKLESYTFSLVASIVAAVPCISPCCVLGLPIGIWAVVVLMKPEIKSAFRS